MTEGQHFTMTDGAPVTKMPNADRLDASQLMGCPVGSANTDIENEPTKDLQIPWADLIQQLFYTCKIRHLKKKELLPNLQEVENGLENKIYTLVVFNYMEFLIQDLQ